MKKSLLIICFAIAVTLGYAQIPNADFETWAGGEPAGYITTNALLSGLVVNVTQSSDKHSGTSAIKVETVTLTLLTVDTIPGFAFSGDLAKNITGFPLSQRPSSLSGFYKSTLSKQDTAGIVMALYKWNPQTNKRDSIAGTYFFTGNTVTTYTPFSATFIYTSSTAMPDTAVIWITSSGKKKIPGSAIYIDDLSLGGVTGTKQALFPEYTLAYPNPAREQLQLNNIPASAAKIEIRDLTGRLMAAYAGAENVSVNVAAYAPGLYHYAVKTENNTVLYSDKFSVVK